MNVTERLDCRNLPTATGKLWQLEFSHPALLYRTILAHRIGNDKLKTSRWVRRLKLCSCIEWRSADTGSLSM